MTALRNLCVSCVLAIAGATMPVFAQGQDTTFTFSAWLPPPLQECGPLQVFRTMAERSGGRLRVEPVTDPAKRAVPGKLYGQVTAGEIDIVWEQAYLTPEQFPLTDLVMLPLTVSEPRAASRALHRLAPDHLAQEFGQVRLIALHVTAPFGLHMRTPIASIEDAAGRRIRAAGAPGIAIVRAMAAEPVPLAAPELQDALATARIDGMLVDPGALITMAGLIDLVHHHLFADIMAAPIYLAMSKAAYDRLPVDLRTVVDEVATPETSAAIAACFAAGYDKALATLKARPDHTVTVLDDKARATARDRLRAAIDGPIAELEAKHLPARAFYERLVLAIAEEEKR